ncbi:hypothetical protein [Aquimarina sp. RZ0]|uniref:hypothetical protein n=1 Tax=Aquimarina sp. RZ0 TaxID=2607730 RepID=UPI0011F37A60|nr:hypothetical protein [Aquimarina sp. RZ0]KAA1243340.1 hypothetical protein F0000_21570 [Aquimarina sp. RZ0]
MFKNPQYFNMLSTENQQLVLQKINNRLVFPNFSVDDLSKILKKLDPPMELRKDHTLIICEYTIDRIKNEIHKQNKKNYSTHKMT